MNKSTQNEIELAAVLNLVPYLDVKIQYSEPISLTELVTQFQNTDLESNDSYIALRAAVEANPTRYEEIYLVDQSSTNSSSEWKDDLIQGCTFRDQDGNYYVSYRGTGDGRWADNGEGMVAAETEMQVEARKYFDDVAERYQFEDLHNEGKRILVTGHSKGGNESQYVFMSSKYEHIIDNCYSFDGQGFSKKAIARFEKQYGERYSEKLKQMYSINGENDFVHDLGIPIIPKDNTYFVKTHTCNSPADYHKLSSILNDPQGNFRNLGWATENNEIVNGEQGELGLMVKRMSEEMMALDEENLHGAAVAVMVFIDALSQKSMIELVLWKLDEFMLGNTDVHRTDFFDFLAHGLPLMLKTLFLTPEGRAALARLISDGVNTLYEKYGSGGVIGGFFVLCLALSGALLTGLVLKVVDLVLYSKVVDFFIGSIDKIKAFIKESKEVILRMKEYFIKVLHHVEHKLMQLSKGYRYATNNPSLIVDTNQLMVYSQRLYSVNQRVVSLDNRMNTLYQSAGLIDLLVLMRCDYLIGYNRRLRDCAVYLSETAKSFANVEKELVSVV